MRSPREVALVLDEAMESIGAQYRTILAAAIDAGFTKQEFFEFGVEAGFTELMNTNQEILMAYAKAFFALGCIISQKSQKKRVN